MPSEIEEIGPDRGEAAVDVLCEAFYDYPVMRFVIGEAGDDYARRLRLLIAFFTEARYLRGDLVLGIRHERSLAAVALIVRPATVAHAAIAERRSRLWKDLGEAAGTRYESFGRATEPFAPEDPHYYLSMIGVRKDCLGEGLARRLLDFVHARSEADPASSGVCLTTEDPANLSLYEYFGYRVVGNARVADFETWGFFRPDSA